MRRFIEDFALIGDLHTAALVSRSASIEWLCIPRFESGACFASLLGDEGNGRWRLSPEQDPHTIERRYRGETLVLETTMRTGDGCVRIIDFMPRRDRLPVVVRIVEGVEGRVPMRTQMACRFEYGSLPPWTRRIGDAITFTVGANAAALRSSVELRFEKTDVDASFTLAQGERATFVLQWYPSHEKPPKALDALHALRETERLWREWARLCRYQGKYREAVVRSLISLKALTYEPTGGCVAAATTSLPENIGGDRNWDYRYAWIRDSAITIDAFVPLGYLEEARAWRDWLLRMLAGAPERLQIMYTASGRSRIDEYVATWLSGYEASSPVRIGNAAYTQFQLGIYGHLMHAIASARDAGIEIDTDAWRMISKLLGYVRDHWRDPDSGIWEYRTPEACYTLSRVEAWVAFDRAIDVVETSGYEGPVDEWRTIRAEIHADVCTNGFNRKANAFVQRYGKNELDASLLLVPLSGFLPIDDPRVQGTIAAIETHLSVDGLIMRASRHIKDGKPNEGAFLVCNFWLAECYMLAGRHAEARALFERLLAIRNDVGLLSEEYDTERRRLTGNFPQTFSHAALVNTAFLIEMSR